MTHTAIAALTAILLTAASGVAFASNDPTPAAAPAAPQATAPATAKSNPDDKVICKYDAPTGSRLGAKKTCMTKAQWTEQSNAARDTMNHQFQGTPAK